MPYSTVLVVMSRIARLPLGNREHGRGAPPGEVYPHKGKATMMRPPRQQGQHGGRAMAARTIADVDGNYGLYASRADRWAGTCSMLYAM